MTVSASARQLLVTPSHQTWHAHACHASPARHSEVMSLSTAIRHFQEQRKVYGTGAALHDVQVRSISKVMPLQILRGMTAVLSDVDPRMFDATGYQTRFATREELLRAVEDPEIAAEMSREFVEAALAKGDEAYAIFEGEKLVSMGWYSNQPTDISDDLVLHFDPAWVYMYKGYTLVSHRGKRLHGIGMSLALRAYTERGSRGLISYVKSNNFSSLRSIARMGYRLFGDVYAVQAFGRVMTWATRGCAPYQFRLEKRPS